MSAPGGPISGPTRGPVRAALCDLDGTLLDTAPDLAAAANRMLAELGLRPLPQAIVSDFIGQGSRTLVERCLEAACRESRRSLDAQARERALQLYFGFYEQETGRTRVFPGVQEGLAAMAEAGLALACVTNKPRRFTLALLARHGLASRFRAVVAGDDVERIKPDPQPYQRACEALDTPPVAAVVIGDSANDVRAGRAAGCRVLCVPYGYREGAAAEDLGGDSLVPDLVAAARWIGRINSAR